MEGWEGSSETRPLCPSRDPRSKACWWPGNGTAALQPVGPLGTCHGGGLCVTDTYHCRENAQQSLLLLTETALEDGSVLIEGGFSSLFFPKICHGRCGTGSRIQQSLDCSPSSDGTLLNKLLITSPHPECPSSRTQQCLCVGQPPG